MDSALAGRLLDVICGNLDRRYPYAPRWVLHDPADLALPVDATPLFAGCFDWHSAVHSHWAAARLARAFPELEQSATARRRLDQGLTAQAVETERAFLAAHPGFEMPYGVAWLLAAASELEQLAPIAEVAADQLRAWLARLPAPIRTGEHNQTAFSMALALDVARSRGWRALADGIEAAALRMYGGDRDAPVAYEPSAHDFLSPTLAEAELMLRLMEPTAFACWLHGFLQDVSWRPVATVDREDGKLAHAAGLNISRAWMLRRIGFELPACRCNLAGRLVTCHDQHRAAFWSPDADASYAETHWLPTFLVYYHLGLT